MIDTTVLNLVTNDLINQKSVVEYELNRLTTIQDTTPDKVEVIKEKLTEYNRIIGEIQLWDSIITNTNSGMSNNESPKGE